MRYAKILGLIAILGALLALPLAVAAPTGASVSEGTQERLTESSAGTVTTEGGNVTQVNVSGYTITDKWAGFWGEVSGSIKLGDSSGNIFYEWTVSDPTGAVVYVTNETISDWSDTNIQPLYATDTIMPNFLRQGTDSFNYTFTNQETFTSNSLTISNVNYTTTWQGGSQGSDFKTYALKASTEGAMIWAAKASADKNTFNGKTADYQVLVGLPAQGSSTTVYFYLELP